MQNSHHVLKFMSPTQDFDILVPDDRTHHFGSRGIGHSQQRSGGIGSIRGTTRVGARQYLQR